MRNTSQGIFSFVVAIAACANIFDALAQGYPVKSIRLVVGFVAGGGADVTARMVGQKLSENFGQPVVVENRPGAGSLIAIERVATAAPDGYTLLMMSSSGVIQSVLRTKLPYDLGRDLAPVSLASSSPLVLIIHPSVPARNVKELIALARSQPGKLSYSSGGVGTQTHLAGELFNLTTKLTIVHVPYKGGGESVIAVAAGQIDISFPTIASALPLIDARKLRPLAITSLKRSSLLPSTPTLDESGMPGYENVIWYGVLAPAGVPKAIIERLNAEINKVVNTPEMKELLNKQGIESQANTPEQFSALIQREIAINSKLVKLTGAKAE